MKTGKPVKPARRAVGKKAPPTKQRSAPTRARGKEHAMEKHAMEQKKPGPPEPREPEPEGPDDEPTKAPTGTVVHLPWAEPAPPPAPPAAPARKE